MLVRKCLDKDACSNFENYFEVTTHTRNTRSNRLLLSFPKLKLEFAKNSFYYFGAKMYNDLSANIRKKYEFNIFTKILNQYLK